MLPYNVDQAYCQIIVRLTAARRVGSSELLGSVPLRWNVMGRALDRQPEDPIETERSGA
jgi:hypothetical protein